MFRSSIVIREATSDDIPFLRAMIWEALLASPTFVAQMGVEVIQQFEDQYWAAWPLHPDPALIAVDSAGRKLGAVLLKPNGPENPPRGWRLSIGVEAEVRGQGVGQQLVNSALSFARAKGGANYVNLFVDPANQRAVSLYRRTGFVEIGPHESVIEMRVDFGD